MITSIKRDWGSSPSLVRITDSTNTLSQAGDAGYLTAEAINIQAVNNGNFDWGDHDAVLLNAVDGNGYFNVSPDFTSLIPQNSISQSTQNLTAHAGGGQANATTLNKGNNTVSTVATAGDSAVLPADVNGSQVTVTNTSANSMNVYPATGDTINALAVNTAIAVAAGATTLFIGVSDTNWRTK